MLAGFSTIEEIIISTAGVAKPQGWGRYSDIFKHTSGNTATQIDFMLFRKSLRKLVMDVKVIPGEEVALQHQLLVCDMMIDMPHQIKPKFTPRPKVWCNTVRGRGPL